MIERRQGDPNRVMAFHEDFPMSEFSFAQCATRERNERLRIWPPSSRLARRYRLPAPGKKS
jgi:hypothetical protein